MADFQKQVIETNTLLVEALGFTIKASFLTHEKTETYNIYYLGSISEFKITVYTAVKEVCIQLTSLYPWGIVPDISAKGSRQPAGQNLLRRQTSERWRNAYFLWETPQGEILYTPYMLSPCSAEQHEANPVKKPTHTFFDPHTVKVLTKMFSQPTTPRLFYFVTSSRSLSTLRPIHHAPQVYMNVHYVARWCLWLMNANQIRYGTSIWIHTQMMEENIHWALTQMFGMGRGFLNDWENDYLIKYIHPEILLCLREHPKGVIHTTISCRRYFYCYCFHFIDRESKKLCA